MRKKMLQKLSAIVIAAVILCVGVATPMKVYAQSATSAMKLTRGESKITDGSATKEERGGAKIKMSTSITASNKVSVNLVTIGGKNASNSVEFTNTSSNTERTVSYLSGYGYVGDVYRAKALLTTNSQSYSMNIIFSFVP